MNYSAVIPEVQVRIAASSHTSACVTAHLQSCMCAVWFVQNISESAAEHTAAFKVTCNISNVKSEFPSGRAAAAGNTAAFKGKTRAVASPAAARPYLV